MAWLVYDNKKFERKEKYTVAKNLDRCVVLTTEQLSRKSDR